jgi:hypothetical protein
MRTLGMGLVQSKSVNFGIVTRGLDPRVHPFRWMAGLGR